MNGFIKLSRACAAAQDGKTWREEARSFALPRGAR